MTSTAAAKLRVFRVRWALSVALAGVVSGCSAGDQPTLPAVVGGTLESVTSYGAANAFFTTGFSDRETSPDTYHVRVKGTGATPPSRVEKIALARAAEIGVETHRKFFKPGAFNHTVACTPAKAATGKSEKVPAARNPVVDVDVVYAKDAADPTYLPAAETFERLSRELAEESVSPDAKTAARASVAAACGN